MTLLYYIEGETGHQAKIALAEAMAAEGDIDLSPEFLDWMECILARLWLFGFAIKPIDGFETIEIAE